MLNNNFENVVGLEIHIQAKTKSKMFCSCSGSYFGAQANSNICPVCLGLPGALPVPNKKALELCINLALALNCQINSETKFDRKNYFYPDLAKGYQISQYDQPIGFSGFLELKLPTELESLKKIRIRRVHLEEDTAKSIHEGSSTLLDFNKSGIPLIEVVTEPDFKSNKEIDVFSKSLRQIVRYLNVSDADMEKGQMRYELNISVKKKGEVKLPSYKVEVKNIGSISLLQKILETEFIRQSEILLAGKIPVQETRGARDMSGKTYSQRVKEEANDYRYFPEPDIPPFKFNAQYLSQLKDNLPELPTKLVEDLVNTGISNANAEILVNNPNRYRLFRHLSNNINDKQIVIEIAKLVVGEFAVVKTELKKRWSEIKVEPIIFRQLVELRIENKINSTTLKSTLKLIVEEKFADADELMKYLTTENLLVTNNDLELKELVCNLINQDPTAKERFKKNPNISMHFVGQIMKLKKGSVDPKTVKDIVEELISK